MKKIYKSCLSGSLQLLPSKSQTLRALLFAFLAKGKSQIFHPLFDSTDFNAMVKAIGHLGGIITFEQDHLIIEGVGGHIKRAEDVIDASNSGLVLRFITAIGALCKQPIVITGDYSIRHQRPMKPLLKALNDLGAKAESTKGDGHAPIIIQGPILYDQVEIEGQDSQWVSALLILAIFCGLKIKVVDPGEKPWVNMTLKWLDFLQVKYLQKDFYYFEVEKKHTISAFTYRVPGDLSTLAFPVAAALITQSTLKIESVDFEDCQGDKKLFQVLEEMGANFIIDNESKTMLVLPSKLHGIEVDINDFVDALPILATLACFATGRTLIYNAKIARMKESNRIGAIKEELTKMGAQIIEKEDGLDITGSSLKGASLFSHHDHRIAMALTVAALGVDGESILTGEEVVAKTYPTFFQDMQLLGASIQSCS